MLPQAKVTIIGNLGGDPETKFTPNGAMLVEFSVAVSKKIREDEITNWYRVTAWGKLGEILDERSQAGDFVKGSQAFVSGDLLVRDYTTQDGREGYSIDVRADSVAFNPPRQNGGSSGEKINIDDVPY